MGRFFLRAIVVLGLFSAFVLFPLYLAGSQDDTIAALGAPTNGYPPGVLLARREINWDGGSATNQNTAIAGNPFSGFLTTRGALFTTPGGTGFVHAPASAAASLCSPGGLAGIFNGEPQPIQ